MFYLWFFFFCLFTAWIGSRHVVTFMLFLGMANAYIMRTNMSVAIVAMVNQTALERDPTIPDDECDGYYTPPGNTTNHVSTRRRLCLLVFILLVSYTAFNRADITRPFSSVLGLLFSPTHLWPFFCLFVCIFTSFLIRFSDLANGHVLPIFIPD